MLRGGNDSARASDADGDEPRRRRARARGRCRRNGSTPPSIIMFRDDPFSGHVVIRTTDACGAAQLPLVDDAEGAARLLDREARAVAAQTQIGAERFRLMPAKCLFTLGVGHMRRRGLEPGARADDAGAKPCRHDDRRAQRTRNGACSWRSSASSRRMSSCATCGAARAGEAGVTLEEFLRVARSLNARGVIGRFSTFLEHVKATAGNERVTRYNALFHWAVPPGREIDAGREVGRHYFMTHAYWREGGPEFHNVNVMGSRTGWRRPPSSRTKRRSTRICAKQASRLDTRTSFGAAAARSSRRRSRRRRIESFAGHGIDPTMAMRERRSAGLTLSATAPPRFALAPSRCAGCTKVVDRGRTGGGRTSVDAFRASFASQSCRPEESQSAARLGYADARPFDVRLLLGGSLRQKARPCPTRSRVPTVANGDVSKDGLTLKYKLRPNMKWQTALRSPAMI